MKHLRFTYNARFFLFTLLAVRVIVPNQYDFRSTQRDCSALLCRCGGLSHGPVCKVSLTVVNYSLGEEIFFHWSCRICESLGNGIRKIGCQWWSVFAVKQICILCEYRRKIWCSRKNIQKAAHFKHRAKGLDNSKLCRACVRYWNLCFPIAIVMKLAFALLSLLNHNLMLHPKRCVHC